MKLSARLDGLVDMVNGPYAHIWDCCCDHGYLGRRLLDRYPRSVIHFVDIVPSLIERIETSLSEVDRGRWQAHCVDLKILTLPDPEARQLVIIAGVGGDLMTEMVSELLTNHQSRSLDLLLCPVRQLYRVRTAMDSLGLGLVDECIVKDGELFYELIYLSTESVRKVSCVGEMWDLTDSEHREYLTRNIEHYQRMTQATSQEPPALQAYRKLLLV